MLISLAVLVLIVLAAVLAYAASRPNTFRVERALFIDAPPEHIFALINDFHHWTAWSPWEKLDPTMTRTYAGAALGKGAAYEWDGKGKAGKGRMLLTRSNASTLILIQLDFIKPFEAHNIAEFTLVPQGTATQVTWAMYGPQPLVAKVMGLVFSMNRLVGGDFETGLANLKRVAET